MVGSSCAAWAGAVRCPTAGPSNATNRPWRTGSATHGQRYKQARRRGAHLAFLDESGFLLIPTRRRTWAPKGYTPIVPYSDKQDRISALAALTVSPKRQHMGLYLRFQPRHFQAIAVADFLRALWRHLRAHIILLWDRGSIHRGPAIEAICQAPPRLHLEEF